MPILSLLNVAVAFAASAHGTGYTIGYIAGVLILVIGIPYWLIRRRRRR